MDAAFLRRHRKPLTAVIALFMAGVMAHAIATRTNLNRSHAVGARVDSLNGVDVFHNGGVAHVDGRNTTADGYNLGLRWQCVEFIKRYYFERFGHRMPDAFGHARDFFDPTLADGAFNPRRALLQFRNGGHALPAVDDIVVYAPWLLNRFGHVAIVSRVDANGIEIIQQNPGPFGPSREWHPLKQVDGRWQVGHERLLGWLRRPVVTDPSTASFPPIAATRDALEWRLVTRAGPGAGLD